MYHRYTLISVLGHIYMTSEEEHSGQEFLLLFIAYKLFLFDLMFAKNKNDEVI